VFASNLAERFAEKPMCVSQAARGNSKAPSPSQVYYPKLVSDGSFFVWRSRRRRSLAGKARKVSSPSPKHTCGTAI
jgi:hypothetical protein